MSDSRIKNSLDHIWHVWINKRQSKMRELDPEHQHESSLYQFKSLLNFLDYGHLQLKDAFEGKLPQLHRQCSHSPEIPILNNKLSCCLGADVLECPILLSLKESFDESLAQTFPGDGEKVYGEVPSESVYQLMAKTCAWHIYKEACAVSEAGLGIFHGGSHQLILSAISSKQVRL